MKLPALANFNEKYLFYDTCTVFRPVLIDGTMTYSIVEDLKNIPCYLSLKGRSQLSSGNRFDSPADREYDRNPVALANILFLRSEDNVLAGDICQIDHYGDICRYEIGRVHNFGFIKECTVYMRGEA